MKKKGWINVYQSGHFHRLNKPCCFNRHGGDIYPTREAALKDIEPPSHYVDTVEIEWVDVKDVQPNPSEATPVPLSQTRQRFYQAEPI